MSGYIPWEIQAEVLKRLPVKPLIQFRSVSKPWKSLIDSPGFAVSYGARRPPPPDDRLILRYKHYGGDREDKFVTLVDNDDDDSFVKQDFVFGPTIPDLVKKFEPLLTTVVGSSHGLLCFNILYRPYPKGHPSCRHPTEMVIVWNPSIRKYVGIQKPDMFHAAFGFGVCPVTFDPTIIRIQFRRKMKVGIFTLSTGAWSILSTNLPRESISLEGSQVIIDRFIYWVAYDTLDAEDFRSKSRYLIMSFDLTAKEFKEINLTDSLANRLSEIQSISKLQESLVLLAYRGEFGEDTSLCTLWMMINEEGVYRSFTKLYNINVLPDVTIYQLLGFWKTGELILATKHNEGCRNAEVEMYNPNSERSTNLGIAGEEYTFFMCSYMETLLLLDQSDGYIYSNSM